MTVNAYRYLAVQLECGEYFYLSTGHVWGARSERPGRERRGWRAQAPNPARGPVSLRAYQSRQPCAFLSECIYSTPHVLASRLALLASPRCPWVGCDRSSLASRHTTAPHFALDFALGLTALAGTITSDHALMNGPLLQSYGEQRPLIACHARAPQRSTPRSRRGERVDDLGAMAHCLDTELLEDLVDGGAPLPL